MDNSTSSSKFPRQHRFLLEIGHLYLSEKFTISNFIQNLLEGIHSPLENSMTPLGHGYKINFGEIMLLLQTPQVTDFMSSWSCAFNYLIPLGSQILCCWHSQTCPHCCLNFTTTPHMVFLLSTILQCIHLHLFISHYAYVHHFEKNSPNNKKIKIRVYNQNISSSLLFSSLACKVYACTFNNFPFVDWTMLSCYL